MPRIATDKLQPGMVLGDDVKDMSGRMLLKSGTELQAKHLKVLRTWGIAGAEVAGDEAVGGEQQAEADFGALTADEAAAVKAELKSRFASVDIGDPFIRALAELVLRRLVVQQAGRQGGRR
jgi:hypothetical protein